MGGVRGVQAPSAAQVQAHPGRFPSKHKPGTPKTKNKLYIYIIPAASPNKATTAPHFMHTHLLQSISRFGAPYIPQAPIDLYTYIYRYMY